MTFAPRFRIEEIGMPIGCYARWGIYMSRNGKDTLVDDFATEQEAVDALDKIHGGRMTERNLYRNPHADMAGKPYQPSTGDEGLAFMELFCAKCAREGFFRGEILRCTILTNAAMHNPGYPDYPAEWTHRADGQPTCTAFEEEK